MLAGTIDRRFGDYVLANEPLARHTTLRVGGSARWFVTPRTIDEAAEVLAFLGREAVPTFMLGGGSNLLIKDQGFDGAVVNLSPLKRARRHGERIRVGAGTPLALVCKHAMRSGLTGMEGLVGIPGTIGGAVYMNAGGRSGEIADCLESALVTDRKGRVFRLAREEIPFVYRSSGLGDLVVLDVTVVLRDGSRDTICERMGSILKKKHLTQPMGERSAGCVFKNPGPGRAAALLIDRNGLKNRTQGDARVSDKHANFIVNDGRASAGDILRLIAEVRREILAREGAALRLEVQVLGPRGLEVL